MKSKTLLILLFFALSIESTAENQVQVMAPGWGELDFDPPQAGSYKLPAIRQAGDGNVVLSDKRKLRLAELYGNNKLTVLSFIYTSCDDVNGCPLAVFVMHSIKNRLRSKPETASRVRMVSLSFDFENDTPEVMAAYGSEFQGGNPEWLFATTDSATDLNQVLEQYGQFIIRNRKAEETKKSSAFSHILKVFLIDQKGLVRNIYSVDFLHPDVLLADIQTLLLEESAQREKT